MMLQIKFGCNRSTGLRDINWLGDHPQPDSDQAVDGMRHVAFRVLLVLFHCLCYKNDVILNDQSNI